MPTERLPGAQRSLRCATGTALSLAASFGLGLEVPFIAPVLALLLLAALNQPLTLKAGVALALVALLTTGLGLLLIPVLRYYPVVGVLLIGTCLFVVFGVGLRGGNVLIVTFLVIGLTMIPAAGVTSFALAATVGAALAKGLGLAVVAVAVSHGVFPESAASPAPPARASPGSVAWAALRATLIVMPTFLLALIDPASYLPIILKAVSLGQQAPRSAHHAGRELLGSTLCGGVLAIAFWFALGVFVHLWMFFLWTLLFGLVIAHKMYRLSPTRLSPGFWLNSLITLLILLGQSVQDSAAGKDVYTAFALRMGLFILVTLYAWLMVALLERHTPASLRGIAG